MNFSQICKRQPAIATVINDAESAATRAGYYNAYAWGQGILSYLVGIDAGDESLRSSRCYDVVIDELAEACERGDMEHEGPRMSILSLACKETPSKEVLETKMLIDKIAFCVWFMKQGKRDDQIGDLARSVAGFFQKEEAVDARDFLNKHHVQEEKSPVLMAAYEEFRWGEGAGRI